MRKHTRTFSSTSALVASLCASTWLLSDGAPHMLAHSGPSLKAPLVTGTLPTIDGTIESAWGPERTGAAAGCTSMNLYALRSSSDLYLAVDVPELVADPDDTLLLFFDVNHSGGSGPDPADRAIRLANFPAGINQQPGTRESYTGNGIGWGSVVPFTTVKSSRTGSGGSARLTVELTVPLTSAPVGFALYYASKDLQDCNGDSDFVESSFKWPSTLPTPGGDPLAGIKAPIEWSDLGTVDKGTFTFTNLPISNFPGWTATANATTLPGDFNGDGKTDLAVTGPADWASLPTAFSNGNGTFFVTNKSIVSFAAWTASPNAEAIAGDFNGDGKTDIAVTGVSGWGSLPVAFSNGDGSYIVTNNAIGGNFAGLAAAANVKILAGDFNGDGKTDIALTGASGWNTVQVAFSNGDGTFTVTPPPILPVFTTAVFTRVALNPAIATTVGSTIGTVFTVPPTIADFAGWAASANVKVLVGDFNGDGRSDIALTGGTGWTTLPVAFSNGNGTFNVTNLPVGDFAAWAATPPQSSTPFLTPAVRTATVIGATATLDLSRTFSVSTVKVLTGDFNGDGKTDIALTGARGWTTMPVAFSNGNGTFSVTNLPIADFASWAASGAAKPLVGDFDHDGKADVALTGPGGWSTLPVAFSNGNGSFLVTNQPIVDFAALAAVANVKPLVGDFNGDGKTDIALVGNAGWTTMPVAFSQSQ